MQIFPPPEAQVLDQTYYLDMMAVGMAGRAAERLIFGHGTPGASSDLRAVSEFARKMVIEWGMGQQLGPVELSDIRWMPSFSEYIKALVDQDTQTLVHGAYERATAILSANEASLRMLARALQTRFQLTGEEISQIVAEAELSAY